MQVGHDTDPSLYYMECIVIIVTSFKNLLYQHLNVHKELYAPTHSMNT